MYVDDAEFGRMTVKNKLKDQYKLFTAQSAGIMFEMLELAAPDLILLNVKDPETDGSEAVSRLKKEGYSGIPVVFVTGNKYEANKAEIMTLCAAYIRKPFSTELLTETIENVLASKRRRYKLSGGNTEDTNKPCILAIDDVSSILRAIHYALRYRYKVYTLTKPEEMKDFLREIKPDLFLLDCQMPVMTGFDLIPVIRGFPEHKETPVIFLTSDESADHLNAAMRMGVCDYIVKPFEPDDLRAVIEKRLAIN
jgi:DNA-binding response OmpR family regulator